MKLYFGMVTRRGILPETFVSMRNLKMVQYLNVNNNSPRALARNEIVSDFLRSDADYLVWLDDDFIFPDNFSDFLNMEAPVCAPVSYVNHYGKIREGLWDWDEGGLQEVDVPPVLPESGYFEVGVVVGCYKVRRDVFEQFPQGVYIGRDGIEYERSTLYYQEDWFDDDGNPAFGEDIYFFLQLRKIKQRITVNPAVKVGHIQVVDLSKVMNRE